MRKTRNSSNRRKRMRECVLGTSFLLLVGLYSAALSEAMTRCTMASAVVDELAEYPDDGTVS